MRTITFSLVSFFLVSILFQNSVLADESTYQLPAIQFTGAASFEKLRDDSYVPVESIPFDGARGSIYDSLKYKTNFQGQNYGYPSGAVGISLGGRSITDTQVTTLGVPLNLAQGGGADFSFFPGYLWKDAKLSPTVTSAGFTPEAASGSIELLPWTREMVKSEKNEVPSRFTASYDRDLQTFSLGTKKENIAMLAGMSTGRQVGPAGELSYYFYKQSKTELLFHLLGSQQEGDSPGSKRFPSPFAKKKVWRVIPVLETHFVLDSDWLLESTAYGDLEQLKFSDPAPFGSSNARTEQYGVENALVHGADTLAISARYVRYRLDNAAFGELSELPLYGGFTHDFFSSDSFQLKATLNANYSDRIGIYPGGKLSAKFASDVRAYPFLELNSIPKMPSLVDRYGIYGAFHGNKDLKPERVNNLIFGYFYEKKNLKSETHMKGEFRNRIQISNANFTSTLNAGNAYLVSLEETLNYRVSPLISLGSKTDFTYSRLIDSKYPYPDLPYASEGASVNVAASDALSFLSQAKLMGVSTTAAGGYHPAYALFDQSVSYSFNSNLSMSAGIDNIFNNYTEVVVDFPLQGRIGYLALQAIF